MKTITVQIGNTDNKLTQKEWSEFVCEISSAIHIFVKEVHFGGGSASWEEWQNYAWVFIVTNDRVKMIKDKIKAIREFYRQDSVAWTEGETLFI
jgi:hypothetical protein